MTSEVKSNEAGAAAVAVFDWTKVPRPYSVLFHPLRFWVDKVLAWIFSIFLPFKITARYPPKPTPETLKMKENLQKTVMKVSKLRLGSACKKWATKYGAGVLLVESILKVPRRHNVLAEWGILKKNEQLTQTTPLADDDFVNVLVMFPVSLLADKKQKELLAKNERSKSSGCLTMEAFDLAEISSDVPIILWFHGGGLAFGTYEDPDGVETVADVVEKAGTFGEKGSGVKHPVAVFASVQYRFAPEHPFPAAPIDGLSVAAHFLESSPSRKINFGGISAGAYMATITAMECFRKYPGQVKSLCAIAPFVGPATDTMSYYMETHSSVHCPVEFLRWCWKAYLELDDTENNTVENPTCLEEFLGNGSTRSAWDRCKWKMSKARRLVEPWTELPLGLDTASSPKIFVVPCTADPLHGHGVIMANAFKEAGASVTHIDTFGSHALGFMLDSSAKSKVLVGWSEAIF